MTPLVVAHRGASAHAPENTFAAFDFAVRCGADALETDLRLTRDGVVVLMHDARLDRTTNRRGRVGRATWEEIDELDAGSWFGPGWRGERVPRLEGFLGRYLGRVALCLEVKTDDVVGPLARLLADRGFPSRPEVFVTSFSWHVGVQLRQLLPALGLGQLLRGFDGHNIERAAQLGFRQVWPRARNVRPELVDKAHAWSLDVMAWDIATRDLLDRVVRAGVDGLTLDDPEWAWGKPTPHGTAAAGTSPLPLGALGEGWGEGEPPP